jgi:polyhydroxybutyrate depolymerase
MMRFTLTLAFAGLSLCLSPLACGGGGETGSGGATTSTGASTGGSTGGAGGGGGTGGDATSTSTTTSSAATTGGAGGSTGGAGGSATTSTGSGGAGPGCLTDLTAGHHEVACDGGITYDVEIPEECAQNVCGLIVDMHGYTMTGDSEDENTGMRALGQQHGYVVVQPTAPKDNLQFPSWNQVTHAPLVYQFMADLAAALPIDPKRVHAMGFSQGGGMTYRLLCQHADFFASGAPIGGLEGCEFSGQNTPSEEVDILQVHGRTDAVVSFPNVAIPQRDAALAAWPFGAPTLLEDDGAHKATRWTTQGGTVYELWEHDYETSAQAVFITLKGHCVPGGNDFDGSPAGYSCEDMSTFVFGQLAMQFFQAHPKD